MSLISHKRLFLIILSLLTLLSLAATPQNMKTGPVRFTIVNNSQHPFSLSLDGGQDHVFYVEGHNTLSALVERDVYSFVMRACNHSATGSIDLTVHKTMYVPVCGGNANALGRHFHNIDASDFIKMVRITIQNETREDIGLYLRTLERDYFLNFAPKETQTLVVPRDTYVYSYVACDELEVGYYPARVRIPLLLGCSGD